MSFAAPADAPGDSQTEMPPDKPDGDSGDSGSEGESASETAAAEDDGIDAVFTFYDEGETKDREQTEGFELEYFDEGSLDETGITGFLFTSEDPEVNFYFSELSEDKGIFFNIGAEGQFYMGAFAAAWAFMLFPSLPSGVLLPLMAIFALVAGGLFALIPAALKIKWGTSETLVTLMLNYVAQKWVSYLKYSYLPWRDPHGGGSPKIVNFSDNAILPNVLGIHAGWIVAILLVAAMYFLLKKTKFGYEVSVIGESFDTARYAGINVSRTIVIAVVLSGGLCALAGMIQASAIEHSLTDNMSNGMGFTAVITTWLSQLDPLISLAVSFVFSVLLQGGSYLQTSMGVPASMGTIIQTIIIFFVLGSEFFVRYRFVFESSKKTS